MSKYENKIFKERPEYNTPEYKQFRYKVMIRDKWCCVLCASKEKLEVHHIKTWSQYPHLRFVVSNGVTLCKPCHDPILGQEHKFEEKFQKIVAMHKMRKQMETGISTKVSKKYTDRKYRPPNPRLRF